MKAVTFKLVSVLMLATFLFSSCGKKNYSYDANGFGEIAAELKSKFGEDAFYSNINITDGKQAGTVMNVTVTKDPASLSMEEWAYSQGVWQQTANVTVEIGSGEAKDFVFNLKDDVDLTKVGGLVEASKKKLADEKQIEDAAMQITTISAPNGAPKSELQYTIIMTPKNGGTSFSFFYDSKGELTQFDY